MVARWTILSSRAATARNGVGTRDMNLCGAQWLAYAFPCRRFAAALTDVHARLRVDVGRYSFIVSDLHRLLVAGLPAHCERFWTLPASFVMALAPDRRDRIVVGADLANIALLARDLGIPLLGRVEIVRAHQHAAGVKGGNQNSRSARPLARRLLD